MMDRGTVRILVGSLTLLLTLGARPAAQHESWPDPDWETIPDPSSAGWDLAQLEQVRKFARRVGTAALYVVHEGRVVLSYGDVKRPMRTHSIRKSLVSALYGTYSASLDLNITLGNLEIDDYGRLTEQERSASVRDLLMARSGVFLPGAYENQAFDQFRPERGAHPPGSYWCYQNWDFNVAGFALELMTGDDLFHAFRNRIADPVGMQDYRIQDMAWRYDRRSWHPAYRFRMSTRDLARFGLLFLRAGRWKSDQIIPSEWVYQSTRWHSQVRKPNGTLLPGSGYGYMWWVSDSIFPEEPARHLFAAVGTGEQFLGVLPEWKLVFVHRTDTDLPPDKFRAVNHADIIEMLRMVLSARGERKSDFPVWE